jgi:hypothetical protein
MRKNYFVMLLVVAAVLFALFVSVMLIESKSDVMLSPEGGFSFIGLYTTAAAFLIGFLIVAAAILLVLIETRA